MDVRQSNENYIIVAEAESAAGNENQGGSDNISTRFQSYYTVNIASQTNSDVEALSSFESLFRLPLGN